LVDGAMRGNPPAPARFASPAPPHVLRSAMSSNVALERNAEELRAALATIAHLERAAGEPTLQNMVAAAKLVTAAALARTESRGGHWRSDYPAAAPVAQRTFMTLADADRIAAVKGAASAQHARK
jgi:L-aspartate oxidase